MTVRTPTLGDVPKGIDPALKDLLERIILLLDIREGRVAKGTKSRFVTIQDLIDAGVISDGELS